MSKQNHSFLYFFAWLIIGVFFGLGILLFRGDIHIDLGQTTGGSSGDISSNLSTPQIQRGYSEAVMRAAPAVVSIQTIIWTEPTVDVQVDETVAERFLGKNSPHRPKRQAETGAGSGVIINANGFILTNYHVISRRDEIRVRLNDGRVAKAKLIGSDPDTDLAVLKIDLENLPALSIANSNLLKVGDIVLAIGDPFAIGQTVSQGIISATGRTQVSQNTYENFIQTDAAINPGNSGGALINTEGEIVGINSNIFSSTGNFQGISFAIPIDLAQDVAQQIIQNGYVVRGWLGVEGQELTSKILQTVDLDSMHGILITDVDKNGPGDIAGLQRGDIITRINRQDILSTNDVLNLVAAGRPGDEFLIEGLRKRQSFITKATLGQRPFMSR
ncbi:Outer membrane stress sensor protease DegS [hydrothermal vent metagenome]|uniref:Outer membrane stress sensor protease DegS n=1 Tax=hydrothermal vent metagenome TaxID=652676 RepID=A0A3B0WJB0_9ZZZZ